MGRLITLMPSNPDLQERIRQINTLLQTLGQELLLEVCYDAEAVKRLREFSLETRKRVKKLVGELDAQIAARLRDPAHAQFEDTLSRLNAAIKVGDIPQSCHLSREINFLVSRLEVGGGLDLPKLRRAMDALDRATESFNVSPPMGVTEAYVRNIRTRVELLQNYASTLEERPPREPDSVLHNIAVSVTDSGMFKVTAVEAWPNVYVVDSPGVIACLHALWLPQQSVFLPQEIAAFEELLNRDLPASEADFQAFFEAHPKWLYLLGEQYEAYHSQVRLPKLQIRSELAFVDPSTDSQKVLIPDFFLKRVGLSLWDVLEIKASDASVLVGGDSRRKLSEKVQDTIAQVREYCRRLQQNEVRARLAKEHSIHVAAPLAMVLIGREFDFASLHTKSLLRQQDQIRVYTYDDLHRLARARAAVQPE